MMDRNFMFAVKKIKKESRLKYLTEVALNLFFLQRP